MSKKYSNNEFIEKVNQINQIIDLSGFNYINSKTNGLCKCKICNHEWYTVSSVLLSGSSCPKCATNRNKQKYTYSTETFINKAKQIHGDKYNYSKVDYKGEKEKIIIICPEHGEFIQEPNSHLSKHGCPKCGNVKKYKTNEAIQILKNKIGNKYDYSKVEYINARTKLDIICDKHGVFKATLNSLLNFHGCPKCKESVSETKIRTILDKTNIKYEHQKKV